MTILRGGFADGHNGSEAGAGTLGARADVTGKRVLVRADLNVPLGCGAATDDTRIGASLPTLELLRDRGAATITVCSDPGSPPGLDATHSIAPARARLSALFDSPLEVLENTGFDTGEAADDPVYAARLARGHDLFVQDAFASVHRGHASTDGIARLLPTYAGLRLESELEHLGRLLGEVERPFVLVCGGAKIADKLPVLRHLGRLADRVLAGGRIADQLRISTPLDSPVELPTDLVGVPRVEPATVYRICPVEALPYGWVAVDIGPATRARFAEVLADARTVFWNGPMGLFEWKPFAEGTDAVAAAVARSAAYSLVAGGDTPVRSADAG